MCEKKSQEQEKPDSNNGLWQTLLVAGVVVSIVWLLSWIFIDLFIPDCTERGTFGDKFGAVNALFSGLAFAGLIVTLLYQKEELTLQREELRATREEMSRQREEFDKQNKTLKCQRFENTFFNMLSLQQEIVTSIFYESVIMKVSRNTGIESERTQYKGREVFKYAYSNMRISLDGKTYTGVCDTLKNLGHLAYTDINNSHFDHYFRHLYRIFKYIDTNSLINDDERYEYASIVRAQLSDYELVMIFYNCLTSNGRAKFKPLIEKYTIFNNLRLELLAKSDDKSLYSETAYDRYAE